MIDLTPLDVRNKRGDFKKLMRGYDPEQVDVFLEQVAERLEELVRENLQLKERTQTLQQQVTSQLGREQAVQDALVTAQELRADIRAQSQREAEHVIKEAETEARRILADAEAEVRSKLRGVERRVEGAADGLVELERRRARFLKEFKQLLERELDVVVVEEERIPLEDRAIDLDLGGSGERETEAVSDPEPVDEGAAADAESPAEAEVDSSEVAARNEEPEPDSTSPAGLDASSELEPTPFDEGDRGPAAPEPDNPVASLDGRPEDDVPRAPVGLAFAAPPVPLVAEASDPPTFSGEEPREVAALPDMMSSQLSVDTELAAGQLPTPLETPSFTTGQERPRHEPEVEIVEELSASMEAEALAEAQSQVVEVTGADADAVSDVPRLEEVLAEAGAELTDLRPDTPDPNAEEIAPPRANPNPSEPHLLYLDPDEPERG